VGRLTLLLTRHQCDNSDAAQIPRLGLDVPHAPLYLSLHAQRVPHWIPRLYAPQLNQEESLSVDYIDLVAQTT
jgi:hypothetical protein